MSKCVRCGSGFLTRKRIKLKDAEVCGKCFKELGFDSRDTLTASVYEYDQIKDGREKYYENKLKQSVSSLVKMTNHGQERELVCTEEERQIYDLICKEFPDYDLRLVRVSDNYVSVKLRDWEIARIKYTNRAKWISFPTIETPKKHELDGPEYIEDFFAAIQGSIEHAEKYEG